MKPTDFAYHLSCFLTTYMAAQRNLSKNTIKYCRDTFSLLIRHLSDSKNILPEKIEIGMIGKESVILSGIALLPQASLLVSGKNRITLLRMLGYLFRILENF